MPTTAKQEIINFAKIGQLWSYVDDSLSFAILVGAEGEVKKIDPAKRYTALSLLKNGTLRLKYEVAGIYRVVC